MRIQQRNARKCITIVENLAILEQNFDPSSLNTFAKFINNLKKHLNKTLNCAVTIKSGSILQLQGDHRQTIYDYLVEKKFTTKNKIVMHGY